MRGPGREEKEKVEKGQKKVGEEKVRKRGRVREGQLITLHEV